MQCNPRKGNQAKKRRSWEKRWKFWLSSNRAKNRTSFSRTFRVSTENLKYRPISHIIGLFTQFHKAVEEKVTWLSRNCVGHQPQRCELNIILAGNLFLLSNYNTILCLLSKLRCCQVWWKWALVVTLVSLTKTPNHFIASFFELDIELQFKCVV